MSEGLYAHERAMREDLIVNALRSTDSAGIVGAVDFRYTESKESGSPAVQASGDSIAWTNPGGSALLACRYRRRRCCDVLVHPDRQRVLAHTGNLARRQELAQMVLAGDETQIPELNETLALALWDNAKQELLLATDRYGSMPLYYRQVGTTLYYMSDVKSILALSGYKAELNRHVLAELLAFGCPLTEETLFEGIRKAPAATIMRFRREGDELKSVSEQYWQLRFRPAQESEKRAVLDHAEDCFGAAVGEAGAQARTAIALTGGIDTRVVLAETIELGLAVEAFTTGLSDSADIRAAKQLSRYVLGRHHELIVGRSFLDRFDRDARNRALG